MLETKWARHMARTVEIDFYRDWIELMRNKLSSEGLDTQKLHADGDVERAFFNFRWRLIPPMPRKVFKASTFSCPPEYSAGLELLESRIVAGENVAPYLSRKLPRLEFTDGLLNDWGIHHLHLGTEQDKRGRIKGTPDVLFARFDKEAAYFLEIQGHDAWTCREFVQIIHDNWPETIERSRLKGVRGMRENFTDSEYATLRCKNGNTTIQVADGTVYGWIGGGIMADGTSALVRREADHWQLRVQDLTESVKTKIDEIARQCAEAGVELPGKCEFKLEIVDDEWFAAFEVNSKCRLLLQKIAPDPASQ